MTDLSTLVADGSQVKGAVSSVPQEGRRWTQADTVRSLISLAIVGALLVVAFVLQDIPGQGTDAAFSLLIGVALGILFERGRFCFFCIFRDYFEKKDSTALYGILAALAVGAVGYAIVFSIFQPDALSGRLPAGAHIGPVSFALVLGGLAFGLGLVLSNGCVAGHLYRLGEGSIRAIPALVGVLAGFGLGFFSWNTIYLTFITSSAEAYWLPQWFGYEGALAITLGVLAVIALVLLKRVQPQKARQAQQISLSSIRRSLLQKRWPVLITGGLVGLVGVFAYLKVNPLGVTAQLGSLSRTTLDEFGLLPETMFGLDTFAGCATIIINGIMDNGWLIIGILAASFAAALPGRRFKIERMTVYTGTSSLIGGILLGWGAMVSLGCTIGVFLSGTQAFALSGWVFAASMLVAVWVGFRLKLHQ